MRRYRKMYDSRQRQYRATLYAHTHNLDAVPDGDTYGRVQGEALSEDGAIDLGSDGGFFGRLPGNYIADYAISNNHISSEAAIEGSKLNAWLEEIQGDIDDIADGMTYAKTRAAALNDGKFDLGSGAGGMYGKLPGSYTSGGSGPLTYLDSLGKFTSFAYVTTRSLDDVTDGTTYKRISDVSAGHQITTDSIATGAITSVKILAGAITSTNIAADGVTNINLGKGAVDAYTSRAQERRSSNTRNGSFVQKRRRYT